MDLRVSRPHAPSPKEGTPGADLGGGDPTGLGKGGSYGSGGRAGGEAVWMGVGRVSWGVV